MTPPAPGALPKEITINNKYESMESTRIRQLGHHSEPLTAESARGWRLVCDIQDYNHLYRAELIYRYSRGYRAELVFDQVSDKKLCAKLADAFNTNDWSTHIIARLRKRKNDWSCVLGYQPHGFEVPCNVTAK